MSAETEPGRRRLVNLAYRLLGSLAEAEDAVQETYARWYDLSPGDRDAITSPEAWLTTVASRICLDVLRSARVRRESYVGEWLPEPLPSDDGTDDPADRVTLDESVSMAFLVVLETMTPAERVAFVLHDVFRYSFAEVAEITGRTPAACRQLASSARRRVRDSRNPPSPGQATLVSDFRRALEAGDVRALIGLLDPEATITADGGGLVPAAPRPVTGADRIARFLVGQRVGARPILERPVNGQPGLVSVEDGTAVTVFAFAVDGMRITRIWAMRNPEKLRPWNP
ncbi:MAG: RNA polymerase sigma factor SigJ [Streptosporangiales bacterium]|nr:RNA polymerase sigma factor SigJ [Streptosporangiales bacterium]